MSKSFYKGLSIAFGILTVCVFLFWMLNELLKSL